jgi:hypothetical protein
MRLLIQTRCTAGALAWMTMASLIPVSHAACARQKRLARKAHPSHRNSGKDSSALGIPLTPKQKLMVAATESVDPLAITESAVKAGFYQATGFRRKFGVGAAGYARQFGASMADGASRNMLGDFAFASLFHEDPRYFREGQGSFKRRLEYALSRTFVTRSDSGNAVFNWSGVLGSAAAAGVANVYYPRQYRTPQETVYNMGWFLLGVGVNNVFQEFLPNLYQHLRIH